MPTRRWHNSLRLFALALELRLNGESSVPIPNDKLLKHPEMAAEDLIASGIDICLFNFESEAICLLHISDVVRSLASDCSKHPGYLMISLDIYLRDLHLQRHPFDEGKVNEYYALMDEWSIERARLREGINLVVQNLAAGLPSGLEQPPLAIYHYRATTSKPTKFGSHSHSCVLSYYPTKVLKIEPEEQDDEEKLLSPSAKTSLQKEEHHYPTWPVNLLYPFNNPDENRTQLPSTILPFIQQLSQPGVSQQLFAMPLSERTMQIYIRSLRAQTQILDGDVSMLTESLIRQNAKGIYWGPEDVLLGSRLEKLKENTPHFARLGPLQTLIARGPERCLELLEVARSLFWSKLLRLRMPFDDFPLPDQLKEELKLVAEELAHCKAQSDQTASQEEAKKQYDLERRFDYLLADARRVPGSEKLLMPKTYDQLLEAAEAGPVVMLIGSDSTYAALIIRRNGVDSIFLDKLTETVLDGMITGLNKATNAARGAMMDDHLTEIHEGSEGGDSEEGRGVKKKVAAKPPTYVDFLEQMWHTIVWPIMISLRQDLICSETCRQRLWWCPTGKLAFLPIHAAGINFGLPTMESTSKYVVSSYTPTLSALLDTRSHHKTIQSSLRSEDLRALILAQPTTKDHDDLPMTLKELEFLETIIPSRHLIHIGDAESSLSNTNVNRTVSEAIYCLAETTILHLACHGHQDRADPLSSGFQLKDGRLTVSHLIRNSTPNAYLAFLSACESASNDFSVPDESLNLAAAMLYAGLV
ncbi:CHAT domain-containing protein [Crepidotus variabilis]|uniref:CHAT domain-containing protein n=1 Tax=Crepidotus variabilis TaxID=179855 RepID=A0A9P6JSX5_9AGAR|nr:CHAT domain-containing protein [Crepidotus variabilis]